MTDFGGFVEEEGESLLRIDYNAFYEPKVLTTKKLP